MNKRLVSDFPAVDATFSRNLKRCGRKIGTNAKPGHRNLHSRISSFVQGSARLTLSLTEVNKLIFVQDFEKASRVLGILSHKFPADYEVQFRRIEVACRTDELGEVCQDLRARALACPQIVALQYAATLAEIRYLEKIATEARSNEELVNPSLRIGRGDVTGLSADAERHGSVAARHILPGMALNSPGRVLGIISQNVRVMRNPEVADDLAPPDIPHLAEASADGAAIQSTEKYDSRIDHPAILNAQKIIENDPKNYASWFVFGCSLEYLGDLSGAIDAWAKAISLNPTALSTLATMAELQQIGAIPIDDVDYSERFESLDKYLVHGTFDTHTELYKEFLTRKEYALAIAALRTLGDWIQRQRGEVPAEIEVLCLFGAMKAYALEGNIPASDACKKEAELIAISVKKSPKNASQLAFIGQIAEEYGLTGLARMCFFSVLTHPEAEVELIVRTAAHCVTTGASPALKECLSVAYKNLKGHAEIRFCQLLCELNLLGVSVRHYMDRKNRIRALISQNDAGTALQLMSDSLADTEQDAEIHYYLGEVLTKLGALEQARTHFQSMYRLDPLNSESALRYVRFLVGQGMTDDLTEVLAESLALPGLTPAQSSELQWAQAKAFAGSNRIQDARSEIEKALKNDAWNPVYISLALDLFTPNETLSPLPETGSISELQLLLSKKVILGAEQLEQKLLERGKASLRTGHNEYAFLLARCLFMLNPKNEDTIEFYSRAGAGVNSRSAAQQTLLFLSQTHVQREITLGNLASCIARVYSHSGEWTLVDEWIDIALKSGIDDKQTRSKLFELEALKLTFNGTDFRKAQSLIEAAIDTYENGQKVPADTGVLHGYLLLAQGDIKAGMEKMKTYIAGALTIQSLYFMVKGLERAGKLSGIERENIAHLFKMPPTNMLEQRLIEEIYCTVGLQKTGSVVNLTC